MAAGLQPTAANERIRALDVVRGFALLGIALMNVEFFNRPLAALGDGLPTGLTGVDAWAAMAVHLLVRDKFFTLFSILFGMGFALMLGRAQAAGRAFAGIYLRRTCALALFGCAHGVLLWAGDVLLSYAVAACLLLVILLARSWMLWLALAVVAGVAIACSTPADAVFVATVLLLDGWVLMHLRQQPAAAGQPALQGRRLLQAGLVLYLLPTLLTLLLGGLLWRAEVQQARIAGPTVDGVQAVSTQAAESGLRRQHASQLAREARVMREGGYIETLVFRTSQFPAEFVGNLLFLPMATGLFLIGAWLLRSGVMAEPWRCPRLLHVLTGGLLPLGGVSTLASVMLAIGPDVGAGRWMFASALMLIGGMLMSLGYIGLLLLALQRPLPARVLGWLAPAGRMALTNYIGQSLLCALFFHGYGLGHWGMPRAQQLLFACLLFALQVCLSRCWLAHFRFGPLEWLWRWLTYGTRPALRLPAST